MAKWKSMEVNTTLTEGSIIHPWWVHSLIQHAYIYTRLIRKHTESVAADHVC